MIKYEGSKKQVEKKKAELLAKGLIVYIEPYDEKTWCLVAKVID